MEAFDVFAVFEHLPELTGLELTRRYGKWIGPYYLSGERHPRRADKIAFTLYHGTIICHEEGGESMSLLRWLTTYGGARDKREALSWLMSARRLPIRFDAAMRRGASSESRYVERAAYEAACGYGLDMCPLFRWMSDVFGRERVQRVWSEYMVTTDHDGLAVFWYADSLGRILHDKRVRYLSDGHRDRTFGGTRRYTTRDGYTSRCYFGSHLLGGLKAEDEVYVVESEKTALLVSLWFGRCCLAAGGKSQLLPSDGAHRYVLVPDMDAREEWSGRGEVLEWWRDWDAVGSHDDIGDYIVELNKRKKDEEVI